MKNQPIKNYLLINNKVRWGLSVYGWIFLALIILVPLYYGFRNFYSVLAPVQREKTDILVLEGFVSDYVLYGHQGVQKQSLQAPDHHRNTT